MVGAVRQTCAEAVRGIAAGGASVAEAHRWADQGGFSSGNRRWVGVATAQSGPFARASCAVAQS